MRYLPTRPPGPARTGLSDPRSTGTASTTPSGPAQGGRTLLTDRRSTR
jgi:hypothetical protein